MIIYFIVGLILAAFVGWSQHGIFGNSVFHDWKWWLALILVFLFWPVAVAFVAFMAVKS